MIIKEQSSENWISTESYEIYIPPWQTAVVCGCVSNAKRETLSEKEKIAAADGITLIVIPVASDLARQAEWVFRFFEEHEILCDRNTGDYIEKLKELFEKLRPELSSDRHKRKRESAMNDDLKLLLKLLLERELEGEAGQNVKHPKKKLAPEPTKGIDYAPDDKKGKSQRSKDTAKDTRR